jgi:hypothetical protein
MLPSRLHIKTASIKLENSVYCAWIGGMLGSCQRACGQWAEFILGQDVQMVLWPLSRWQCSICQGYTSRFPGYISKATMLPVSESGASRKKENERGRNFILDRWSRGEGGHFDCTHAQKQFLGCIEFRKSMCSTKISFELLQYVQP